MAFENVDDVFDQIEQGGPNGRRTPRLPSGASSSQYRVLLKRYTARKGHKNKKQIILEADFLVLTSTNPNVEAGATLGWAFFPGNDEFGYGDEKSKAFLEACGVCVGDRRPSKQIGVEMYKPDQPKRGVLLDVVVTAVLDDNGQQKKGKSGLISEVDWTPIVQSPEQVAAQRAHLDQISPLPVEVAPTQTYAPPLAPPAPPQYAQQPPPGYAPVPQQYPVQPPAGYPMPQGAPQQYAPPQPPPGYAPQQQAPVYPQQPAQAPAPAAAPTGAPNPFAHLANLGKPPGTF